MIVVEDIPLAEFYFKYRNHLAAEGHTILILAVVRDADAPHFYEDVLRYWSSLHDLTGPGVVFAVAGPPHKELAQQQEFLDDTSSQMLIGKPGIAPSIARYREKEYFRYAGNADLWRDDGQMRQKFLDSNSAQILALSRSLGLEESLLPCLHISVLKNLDIPPIVVNLDTGRGTSVYSICKEIVIGVGPIAESFTRMEAEAKALHHEQRSLIENIRIRILSPPRANQKSETALAHVKALARQHSSDLLENIFNLLSVRAWDANAREKIFSLINDYKKSLSETEWLSQRATLQRAADTCIDIGFVPTDAKIEDEFRSNLNSEKQVLLKENEISLEKYEALREHHENSLVQSMSNLEHRFVPSRNDKLNWDYFISYPSSDQGLAESIYRAIPRSKRIFFDKFCLRPGERWRNQLEAALDHSSVIIVLITANTTDAFYQISEIQRAITLHRKRKIRILPIVAYRNLQVPLGLEQFQSLYLSEIDPKKIEEQLNFYTQH